MRCCLSSLKDELDLPSQAIELDERGGRPLLPIQVRQVRSLGLLRTGDEHQPARYVVHLTVRSDDHIEVPRLGNARLLRQERP